METTTITLSVQGMTCGHCARAVKELAEEVQGVTSASVDLEAGRVSVDVTSATAASIIENINSSNIYQAQQP